MSGAVFQPFPMLPRRAAQIWRHQPAYRRPRHFHEEPEVNAVIRGSARIGVGDRSIELGPGELVLFEPGQDHVLLAASDDLELFVMALRPALADRVRGPAPRVLDRKIVLDTSEVGALGERALALGELRDGAPVERQLADFFGSLGARPATSRANSRRALGELRSAPGLRGTDLSRRLRTAQAKLSRDFHGDVGVTLVEYRARLRVMRFIRCVDAGASFATAAFQADFGSYAQCHRSFLRATGFSPRDYFGGARSRVDEATERQPGAGLAAVNDPPPR